MSDPRLKYHPPRNQRLDMRLYATAGQPCFVTARASVGRSPFNEAAFANTAIRCLLAQQAKSHCRLDVYCLMTDHLHAVITPDVEGASSLLFVNRFKGWCTRELHLLGWGGPVWQPRSYDHLLRREDDLASIFAYILHNPVRRGLCTSPEDWPWSGPAPIVAPS